MQFLKLNKSRLLITDFLVKSHSVIVVLVKFKYLIRNYGS